LFTESYPKTRLPLLKVGFIFESIMAAHEVIHEVHSKKLFGLVLQLDYKKAYDQLGIP
jgi:hypothetical protein